MESKALDQTKAAEPYHHGNLRAALISAAELELAENGAERFSLRACARRANVSHAAPAHHFGDTAGLLDALAALGFERLCKTMQIEMDATGKEADNQLAASAVGYVRYAVENPHLFKLMFATQFRAEASAELIANSEQAFLILVEVVAKRTGSAPLKATGDWIDIAALWAGVHGYAQLLIDNQMTLFTSVNFDGHRNPISIIALRSVLAGTTPTHQHHLPE